MNDRIKNILLNFLIASCLLTIVFSCENYYKDDFKDNSPTSGKLNVYYDEGLYLHVKNQAYTFQSQYTRARINLFQKNDDEAIKALYNDSCEAIVISRLLNKRERDVFESKKYFPKYSVLAYNGIAFIANINSNIRSITKSNILNLLTGDGIISDSVSNPIQIRLILDKNNSSVTHYVVDSISEGKKLSTNVNVLKSTLEALDFVSNNKNTVACIDFAWLSDVDDSITKHYLSKVKLLGIETQKGHVSYPSQSSFKLNTYPFTRKIYCYRKTGDFSLAKGFESFMAGPKGQMIFLKQGLLPNKQQERMVEVKFEPLNNN